MSDEGLKTFVTRKRSLARKSIQNTPGKSLFSLNSVSSQSLDTEDDGSNNNSPSKMKRPISIMLIDQLQTGPSRIRPLSFISTATPSVTNVNNGPLSGPPALSTKINPFKLDISYDEVQTQKVKKDVLTNFNLKLFQKQYNINKFNLSIKADIFKDFKFNNFEITDKFNSIYEKFEMKTPVINEFKIEEHAQTKTDFDLFRDLFENYNSKITRYEFLNTLQYEILNIDQNIRLLIYQFIMKSKCKLLEIYYRNNTETAIPDLNGLKLKILGYLNISIDYENIDDLNMKLENAEINTDLLHILKVFTIYYRFESFRNFDIHDINSDFKFPNTSIIAVADFLVKNLKAENSEIFVLLIQLNENYLNFDNDLNNQNLTYLKNKKLNIPVRRANYYTDVNKDGLVFIFNRILEDIFPEILIYFSVNGISTNLLLEKTIFEFFYTYELSSVLLFKILDYMVFQGIEFLIKFVLLILEKNYFEIFKLSGNDLLEFLTTDKFFEIIINENENTMDFKGLNKFIIESFKFEFIFNKYAEEFKKIDLKELYSIENYSSELSSFASSNNNSQNNRNNFLSRNSSQSSLSSSSCVAPISNPNDELISLLKEKKNNKDRLTKIKSESETLNELYHSYQKEIFQHSLRIEKLRENNKLLKMEKENLEQKLQICLFNHELVHSIKKNKDIESINKDIKEQINSNITKISDCVDSIDLYNAKFEKVKTQHAATAAEITSPKSFLKTFGW